MPDPDSQEPTQPKPIPIFLVPVGEGEPDDLVETAGTVNGADAVIQWLPGKEQKPEAKP